MSNKPMYSTLGFGVPEKGGKFKRVSISRSGCGPDDVEFDVLFCGVCHSDVHIVDDLFGSTKFPIVPGHELAGKVIQVGENVTKLKVGDKVGVGCMVDSCMDCKNCSDGEEHICLGPGGPTMTYNGHTKHGHVATDAGYTFGGYSTRHTVPQRFAVKIPDAYPLEKAGPVFCAGVTMYSPLKTWKADKGGLSVGVIGIGGLGQMGVRLAKAMGNTVTAISTSPGKEAVAKSIGADKFVVSSDADSMKSAAKSLDLILNTVSAPHQVSTYIPLLRRDGTIVQLGLVTEPHLINQMTILSVRARISGSHIGGMPDTQEVIDFCHQHGIEPETEIITADRLDEVYEALNKKNDSIKRFVIDMVKSEKESLKA